MFGWNDEYEMNVVVSYMPCFDTTLFPPHDHFEDPLHFLLDPEFLEHLSPILWCPYHMVVTHPRTMRQLIHAISMCHNRFDHRRGLSDPPVVSL
jgi:hypothetical protein